MCAARMAKKNRQTNEPAAPMGPLGKARFMLEAGDVRRARHYAEEAASSGTDAEKADARVFLEHIQPDRAALLTVAIVLLMIMFAAWTAILRPH
jgi:hypothetical protein